MSLTASLSSILSSVSEKGAGGEDGGRDKRESGGGGVMRRGEESMGGDPDLARFILFGVC